MSLPPLTPLPIDSILPDVLDALRQNSAVVIQSPPGSGKTTRVPPAVLLSDIAGRGKVVVLEPRRIATRAACRRIAAERGWQVGREVGYQVRFERRAGPDTRLLFCTEGILLRHLQDDPLLEDVAVVVFDEFHERTLEADVSLAMVLQIQREVRPDLKLAVMSATLDAGAIAAHLGDCPVIEGGGRLHPVEVVHIAERTGRELSRRVAEAVRRALDRTRGDILVFLPGIAEIRRAREALLPLAHQHDLAVSILHGSLPVSQQDAALMPGSRRKVVLTTNVAETSLTVEGVETVVDSGLARILRFDPSVGLDRLQVEPICRASAEQRTGRAGRLRPGVCFRLWSAHEHAGRPPALTPDIQRIDLSGALLQILAWGERDPSRFPWLEPPEPSVQRQGLDLLDMLGAITGSNQGPGQSQEQDRSPGVETRKGQGQYHLTELGRFLARFPLHPRLARLLVEGHRLGHVEAASLTAAMLSERDPFSRAVVASTEARDLHAPIDILERLRCIEECNAAGAGIDRYIDPVAARSVLRARDQLRRMAGQVLGRPPEARVPLEEAVGRAALAAYPDRLARRRPDRADKAVMVGGRGLQIGQLGSGDRGDLLVALDVDAGPRGQRSVAQARSVCWIQPDWIDPAELSLATRMRFDARAEKVVAEEVCSYSDLVLFERSVSLPDMEKAAQMLAEAAAANLTRSLALDRREVARFLSRVGCLDEWMPELGLPRFDRDFLLDLLPSLCAGLRSFAELGSLPLVDILAGLLTHEQRAALDREVPDRLQVPSGSRLQIQYEPGKPPVLAVRIQEVFGWTASPRLAKGRVTILLHLLAPSGRPQQVTDDLASFWKNTYPEVRRELRGRYPRHAWPEDPLTARPERRPERRRG